MCTYIHFIWYRCIGEFFQPLVSTVCNCIIYKQNNIISIHLWIHCKWILQSSVWPLGRWHLLTRPFMSSLLSIWWQNILSFPLNWTQIHLPCVYFSLGGGKVALCSGVWKNDLLWVEAALELDLTVNTVVSKCITGLLSTLWKLWMVILFYWTCEWPILPHLQVPHTHFPSVKPLAVSLQICLLHFYYKLFYYIPYTVYTAFSYPSL